MGGGNTAQYPPPLSHALGLTLAFKLLGRRGKEQLALHIWGPSTAGNTWLLVACLHPAGQPAEVAVTVQRIGTNGPGSENREKQALQLHGVLRHRAPRVQAARPGTGKNPNRPHFKSVSCGFKHSFRPFICVTLLSPHHTLLSPFYTLKLRLKKMKAFA